MGFLEKCPDELRAKVFSTLNKCLDGDDRGPTIFKLGMVDPALDFKEEEGHTGRILVL